MAGQQINAYNAFNQYGGNQYNSAPFAYNQYAQNNPNMFAYSNPQIQDTVAFGNSEVPVEPAIVPEKKSNSKTWLIAGGIALAAGLIFHKRIGKALGLGEEVAKGGGKSAETLTKEGEKLGEEVVENTSASHLVPTLAGAHSEEVVNRLDGTISHIHGLDSNGKRLHTTWFNKDGKTVSNITKYDVQTGKEIEKTFMAADSKTVSSITKCDAQTGKEIETTFMAADGKTVRSITKYDVQTGRRIETTLMQSDGKTVSSVGKYDAQTGNEIESTWYKEDGLTVHLVSKYDPVTGEKI